MDCAFPPQQRKVMPRPLVTPPCSETPSPKEDPPLRSQSSDPIQPFCLGHRNRDQRPPSKSQVGPHFISLVSERSLLPTHSPSLGKAGREQLVLPGRQRRLEEGAAWEGAIITSCGCRSQVTLQKPLVQKLSQDNKAIQGRPLEAWGGAEVSWDSGWEDTGSSPPRRKDTGCTQRMLAKHGRHSSLDLGTSFNPKAGFSAKELPCPLSPVLPAHRAMSSEEAR